MTTHRKTKTAGGSKGNRRQQARHLLAELELPSGAIDVLDDERYHDASFCKLFLDKCDEVLFEDPREGFTMAMVAPQLARKLDPSKCPGGERRQKELEMYAQALLGRAHRAIGALKEAEVAFAAAWWIARNYPISEVEKAHLDRRLAVLRIDQRRFDEAHELLDDAIATYREDGRRSLRKHLGIALSVKGTVCNEAGQSFEAARLLTEALRYLDPRRSPRPYHATVNNLVHALARGTGHPDDLARALHHLKRARRRLRTGRKSLPGIKLRWAEGLLLVRFGATRRAESTLTAVREDLAELETPYEVAMVSLDLASLLLEDARYTELRRLAAETFTLFQAISSDREACAALRLWQDACAGEQLSDGMLDDVREALNGVPPTYASPTSAAHQRSEA